MGFNEYSVLINIKSPCKDCSKRHLGCHSECAAYIDYKSQRDKESEMIQSKKKKENDINGYFISSKIKSASKSGKGYNFAIKKRG